MQRQIIIDTETTGLSPQDGHRIIEIGAVELVNRRLTGKRWQRYLKPNIKISEGAFRVHGISDDFLADKPMFAEIAGELLEFLRGDELVIHNAPFDMGFFDYEFGLLKQKPLSDLCSVLDTLTFARQKHPGQKNNLDALCKRYNINNSHRQLHGALLDAEILAEVYLAMTGGQESLVLSVSAESAVTHKQQEQTQHKTFTHSPLTVLTATPEEVVEHQSYLEKMQKANGKTPLWLQEIN